MSSKLSNQIIFENWRKFKEKITLSTRNRIIEAPTGKPINLPAATSPEEKIGLDDLMANGDLRNKVDNDESYAYKMVVQIEQGAADVFGHRTHYRLKGRAPGASIGGVQHQKAAAGKEAKTAQFIKISYFDDTEKLLSEFIYPNYNEVNVRRDKSGAQIDIRMLGIDKYICLDSSTEDAEPGQVPVPARGIRKDGWIEGRLGLQLLWAKIVEQMKTKNRIPQADFLVITEQHTLFKPTGTIGQFSPKLKMKEETNLGTKSKSAVTSDLIVTWLKEYINTKRTAKLKRSKAYINLKKLQKEASEQPDEFSARKLKYKNKDLSAAAFLELIKKAWNHRKDITVPDVEAEDEATDDKEDLNNFIEQAKRAWRGAPKAFTFEVTRLRKSSVQRAGGGLTGRNMIRKKKKFGVTDIDPEFYKVLKRTHVTKKKAIRPRDKDYPEQLRELGGARRIYHVKDMAEDGKTIFWFIANVKDKKIEYIFLPIVGEVSKTEHLINRIRYMATDEKYPGAPGVKTQRRTGRGGSALDEQSATKSKDLAGLGFIPFSVAQQDKGVRKAVGKTGDMGSTEANDPVRSLAAAFGSSIDRQPVQKPTSSKYKLYSGAAGRLAAARNVDIEKVKEARKLEKTRGRSYPEDSHFSVEPLEKVDREIGIGYRHYKVTKKLDKDGLPELLRRDAGTYATGAWKKTEATSADMIGHIHNPNWAKTNKLHIYDKVAAKLFIPGSKDPAVAEALDKYINDPERPERLKTMASVLQRINAEPWVGPALDKDPDEALEILGERGEPGSLSGADGDLDIEFDFEEPDQFSIIATVFNVNKPSEKFQQYLKQTHDLGNYEQNDKIYVQLTNPKNFPVEVGSIDIQPPEMRRKFSLYINDSDARGKRPGQAPGKLESPLQIEPGRTLGGADDDPIYFYVEAAAGANVAPNHAKKAREEDIPEAGAADDPKKVTGEEAAPWKSGESRDGYVEVDWAGPQLCGSKNGRWDTKAKACWVPEGTDPPVSLDDDDPNFYSRPAAAPKVNQAVASAVAAADPNAGQSLDFLKKYGGLDPHKIKNKKYGPTIRKIYPKIGNANQKTLKGDIKMVFDFEKNKERYSNLKRKASVWRDWVDKLDDGDPRKTDVAGGELIKQNFDKVIVDLRKRFKGNKHPTMEKVYKLIDTGFFGGDPEIEDIKKAFSTLHHHYDDQSRRIEKWLQRNSEEYGTSIAQIYKTIPPEFKQEFPGMADPHELIKQADQSRQLDSLSDLLWNAIKTNYQERMKSNPATEPTYAAQMAISTAITGVFKGDTNADGLVDKRDAIIPQNVLRSAPKRMVADKKYVQSKLANWICPDTGVLDAACVLKGLTGAGMASRFDVQPEKEPEAEMTATTTPIIKVPGLGIRVNRKPGAEVHEKYGERMVWADGDKKPPASKKFPKGFKRYGHVWLANTPNGVPPIKFVEDAAKINKAIDDSNKLSSTEAEVQGRGADAVLCRSEGGTWDVKNKKCSVDLLNLPPLAKLKPKVRTVRIPDEFGMRFEKPPRKKKPAAKKPKSKRGAPIGTPYGTAGDGLKNTLKAAVASEKKRKAKKKAPVKK